MLASILACDKNGGIGRNNKLPWPHNISDLKYFREKTNNSVIVMGRNTWDSLPKKPLPKRINIVVSSSPVHQFPGADKVVYPQNLTNAFEQLSDEYQKDVFCIGGAQLYRTLIPICDTVHLTRIHRDYIADTKINLRLIEDNFELHTVELGSYQSFEIWRKT